MMTNSTVYDNGGSPLLVQKKCKYLLDCGRCDLTKERCEEIVKQSEMMSNISKELSSVEKSKPLAQDVDWNRVLSKNTAVIYQYHHTTRMFRVDEACQQGDDCYILLCAESSEKNGLWNYRKSDLKKPIDEMIQGNKTLLVIPFDECEKICDAENLPDNLKKIVVRFQKTFILGEVVGQEKFKKVPKWYLGNADELKL